MRNLIKDKRSIKNTQIQIQQVGKFFNVEKKKCKFIFSVLRVMLYDCHRCTFILFILKNLRSDVTLIKNCICVFRKIIPKNMS